MRPVAMSARQEIERKQLLLARKRKALDAQVAALQLELETEEQESLQLTAQEELKLEQWDRARGEMARSRSANRFYRKATAGNARPPARPQMTKPYRASKPAAPKWN